MSNVILNAALSYAKHGLSVIPIGHDKKPLVVWLQYQKRRATEPEIREWFIKWPEANIGIVTGRISGLSVVDVEKGGSVADLPETAIARTGGGGWHYYYRFLEGLGNKTRLRELTDIRSEGGYVVAPPSLHASGNRYQWTNKSEFKEFPKELLGGAETKNDWSAMANGVPSGNRRPSAAKIIGKLLASFSPDHWETAVWPIVVSWNLKNDPPLKEEELRHVFDTLSKKDIKNPRHVEQGEMSHVVEMPEGPSFITFKELLSSAKKELQETKAEDCVSFGYDFLDEIMTGIFKGELAVFGGESGSGKTTLCNNIIYKAARRGVKCAVFALEDRLEEYGMKAMYFKIGQIIREEEGAMTPNYTWNDFRKNNIKDGKIEARMEKAEKALGLDNVDFFNVNIQMNIDILEAMIDEKVKEGVELFLVDHLHYFDLHADKVSKADYIEKLMVRLKTMQKRNGARIMLIAHYRKLNGTKPTLDSFKDSVAIIQNANYVINIWRDRKMAFKDKNETSSIYTTTFFIPKARNPNGEAMVEVTFNPATGDYDEHPILGTINESEETE